MNGDNRVTLPASELRRIRQKLGLSRDEFAIELGYEGTSEGNTNTMRRFETGRRGLPLTLAKLIFMIDVHGLPDTWPAHLEAKLPEGENGNS
jgi:DNA-binding transcriptional regulator YiaG